MKRSVTSLTLMICVVVAFLFVACGGTPDNQQEMLKQVAEAQGVCPPQSVECGACNGCRLGLTLCYGIGVTTCSRQVGAGNYRMTCTPNGWTSNGAICNGTETY
jgi:hypothetical protein